MKIRNADTGEWVVQHINYPSPMDIDTFVTDSTGTLMLPEALGFGNYELYEQQSPGVMFWMTSLYPLWWMAPRTLSP